ncbi:hypothetical protein MPH_08841 [Macrophomina phaseolina MS6]|uniref:Fungal transcriptional regulatory protein n=1 Tax=Macrophomina phaseolina (strain MS6) TaxID=1126212 RepID=K2RMD8_MACPH|nr:hypothetical protein MPH_08841 [Macrophomina phaseolina MS6]
MADSYYESLLARPRPGSARQIPHKEAYLLDYFTSFICPNCSLSPTHNPYLRYIVPMALTYEPLHHAILSVAANQMRLLNDNRYEREAWAYKNHAMKGLQTSIDRGEVGWQFVATILMLCFYDISDGCDVSWMTHLKGGMSVLEHVRKTGSAQSEAKSLSKFFVMYFVAHQIMGLTAQGTESGLPQHYWLEDDSMEEIDVLMGCSRGLLSLIDKTSAVASRYTALSHDRAFTTKELEEICSTWEELSTEIQKIPQVAPSTAINKENLVRVAESKRTTALIYLHDRFSPFLPSETSFIPTSKLDLVPKLVSELSRLPTTPTLLWPLFVLGRSSPEREDYRRFVLDRLIEMQRLRNLGSVRLARRLVEDEYRRWDLNMEGDGLQYEIGVRGKWVSLA